jgi:hypothetical protein
MNPTNTTMTHQARGLDLTGAGLTVRSVVLLPWLTVRGLLRMEAP